MAYAPTRACMWESEDNYGSQFSLSTGRVLGKERRLGCKHAQPLSLLTVPLGSKASV